MNSKYEELSRILERAMAIHTGLVLLEWDNETLAPAEAGDDTGKVQGILSAEYQQLITGQKTRELIAACQNDHSLNEVQTAIVREAAEEAERLGCIPPAEYRAYTELTSKSARIWAKARSERDFSKFAPVLEEVISYQKKFASYRAKEGQKLYNIMLDSYEKEFDIKHLDLFFDHLKAALVPLLKQVSNARKQIDNSFLSGDYAEEKQQEAAHFLAEYVGFDFNRGVLAVSAHPFTTNLHNHDVRITTHYNDRVDSSIFSVIHEAGHGIYELGIADELTLTLIGQGASMGMHESQSRFFENMIGRHPAFWEPLYGQMQEWFPEQLDHISLQVFTEGINKVTAGLIRTEADELTYSLHVLIRYELEKALIEDNLNVLELPKLWADKYEEYLGVRPEHDGVGVLQDIHWSQGSFGYFPSYALGSAFAAQIHAWMEGRIDFAGHLREGRLKEIRECLREHIHQYGKLRPSRELLKSMTGEDFNPDYYVKYLQQKYKKLYEL